MNKLETISPIQMLVKSRYGYMLANQHDVWLGQSIIDYGECAEEELWFLRRLIDLDNPASIVDVGANIGIFTLPLAKMLAQKGITVIAFEPQPFIFRNLCANLALNDIVNVDVWPFAVGSESSTLYFNRPNYGAKGNFGGVGMVKEKTDNTASVPCVTLDHALGEHTIQLLKIDVEGMELEVIKGADRIIKTSRPIIYCENDREECSEELIKHLWSLDYNLWWHFPFIYNKDNFFGNINNRYKNIAAYNMLCIPKETNAQISKLDPVVDFDRQAALDKFNARLRAKWDEEIERRKNEQQKNG